MRRSVKLASVTVVVIHRNDWKDEAMQVTRRMWRSTMTSRGRLRDTLPCRRACSRSDRPLQPQQQQQQQLCAGGDRVCDIEPDGK